tara:strand:+ start:44 stop:337 length:294 start_codon:yes stop_codon:yes gene_type:complete
MKYVLESWPYYFTKYKVIAQDHYIILGIFFAVLFICICVYLQNRKLKINKLKYEEKTSTLLEAEKKLKTLNKLLEKERIDYYTYKSKVSEIASKLDL